MASPPRTRLEQLVQAKSLSVPDFMAAFHQAGTSIDEQVHVSRAQAKRWLAGDSDSPRSAARRVLEHWFGEPIEVLMGAATTRAPLVTADSRELLVNAGRESADHALHAASALNPAALESLHADIARFGRDYYTTPPLSLLGHLVPFREKVLAQLARTRKPRQEAELYLIAGEACGLLSSVAFDLGHTDPAEEFARAAYTYASIIDHPSLATWARALTVSVLLWSGQYREVIRVATTAAEQAPIGTGRARLYAVRARAYAYLGAANDVAADLAASADELDRAGDDELMDSVGGELGFDRTRRALCAGAAYVALRDGERAQAEAETAVELFAEIPAPARWRAGELAAWTDLASARTLAGDLAGAEDALHPVVNLAANERTEALTQRMTNLGRMVSGRAFRGAIEAARIRDAVSAFTANALPATTLAVELPRALPSS